MKIVRGIWIGGLALMLGALAACAGPAASTSAPTAAPVAAATDAAPTAAPAPTAVPAATEAAQPTDVPLPTEAPPAALKVTGLVASEIGWSMAELKAMPATAAGGQNNKGEAQSYSGVLLADLLKAAGPKPNAVTVVFLGEGGTQLEVPLAEIQTCPDCIASFRSQGGFSLMLPYYSKQLALKGLKELQVK